MLIKIPSRSDCSESEVTSKPSTCPVGVCSVLPSPDWRWPAACRAWALPTNSAMPASSRYRRRAGSPKATADPLAGGECPGEAITPFKDATHYNNFYEFGPNKGDPAENASALKTEPWSVVIDGEVGKPGTYALEDFVKPYQLEERIYRLRCVEAWSMVIPWLGFPLADLLKRVEPNGQAKFVRFETLQRPEQMVGQRSGFSVIDWPYMEGLRMDEAMHPLAILAVGMYGRLLPNQNGAPLRLVVPWKYGFKSIKSIVRISLVREQPKTTWESIAANEYGFYANVNPQVDHPRWSQARERRLPSGLFSPNVRDTQMFNGYGSEVASLYSGMDLRKYY